MKQYIMSGAAQRLLAVPRCSSLWTWPLSSFIKGMIFTRPFHWMTFDLVLIYFIHVSVTTGPLLPVNGWSVKSCPSFPTVLSQSAVLPVLGFSGGRPSTAPRPLRVTINFSISHLGSAAFIPASSCPDSRYQFHLLESCLLPTMHPSHLECSGSRLWKWA